jgi:hypothetical protein
MSTMRSETRLTINGRRWRIRLVPAREMPRDALGDCDHPPGPHPTIRVRRNLTQQRLAEVVCHELLHASLPQLSEEAVTDTAAVLGRVLFSLGWRRKSLASRQVSR